MAAEGVLFPSTWCQFIGVATLCRPLGDGEDGGDILSDEAHAKP